MCDLLWSDPYDTSMLLGDVPQQQEGSAGPADTAAVTAGDPLGGGGLDAEGWAPSSRGAGMLWGPVSKETTSSHRTNDSTLFRDRE